MIASFFVRVLGNLRTTRLRFFVIDMRKHLKNAARVFTWIEEEDKVERRKLFLPDTVCIEYFLYLLKPSEVSFELLFSIYIY